ncbi:MAG: hypothetical protein GXP59_02035 [Deltaproteobacteria bacterium]|nr:hypothetical protein [Deltaproteobacteria bacterium]
MARAHNPYGAAERAARSIDRGRERERQFMLQNCYKHADDLALQLVQRLLDKHIIETTSERAIREVITKLLTKIADMDEFDIQFKIAPIRTLVPDPNIVTLYLTQYMVEDLIEHPDIQDIFGDDLDVYKAVDSVMNRIRPSSD